MKEAIQEGQEGQEGLTPVPPIVRDLRLAAKDIPTLKELCWLQQKGKGLTVWAVFGEYNKEHLFTFFNIEWDLRRQAMDQRTPLGKIQVLLSDLLTPQTMRQTIPPEAGRIPLH